MMKIINVQETKELRKCEQLSEGKVLRGRQRPDGYNLAMPSLEVWLLFSVALEPC